MTKYLVDGVHPLTKEPVKLFNWRAFDGMVATNQWPDAPLSMRMSQEPSGCLLGGQPRVRRGTKWPVGNELPLSFVGQLDFAQLQAFNRGPFPRQGCLSLFVNLESQPRGYQRTDRALWSLLYSSQEEADELIAPAGVRVLPRAYLEVSEEPGVGHQLLGAPRWIQENALARVHFLSGGYVDVHESVAALEEAGARPDAFLLDRVEMLNSATQLSDRGTSPEMLAAGIDSWVLLWQIASEPALDLHWGDEGFIYIFVERHRLRVGDFSRAWIILQHY